MADIKRDSPIPAENVDEARPWRLPFWTEPAAFVVEREQEEQDDSQEDAPEETAAAGYPTAEELEVIRREAYNDGLEQGRVEGRQQGIQEGREEGHAEGHKRGYDEGMAEGRREGNKIGFEEGRAEGQADVTAQASRLRDVVATLQAAVTERDSQLPEVLVMLVTRLTEQVLEHELSAGAQSINRYVRAALQSLPDGEKAARVFVSEQDKALIDEAALRVAVETDDSLAAGECRVESENSLVEYSVSDHLQQALLELAGQMLTEADGYPTESESAALSVQVKDAPQDSEAQADADQPAAPFDDVQDEVPDDSEPPLA